MSQSADRNLLFGILAVQLDFISKDALISAMNAWLLDKSKPLGELLVQQGQLNSDRFELLSALVAEHIRQHSNDAEKSLAALSSIDVALTRQLGTLPDADIQQSVAIVGKTAAAAAAGEPAATLLQPPPAESAAGRYRILRPHARGGLGEVYVAEDTELGREVALKEIRARHAADTESRCRFVLEAEVTGGLEHPGIVPVYGLGAYADGRPYYAMRFVKGDNLRNAIERFHAGSAQFDSLEFRELLGRFVDVCQAIAYAHSRGVLHRDLKPGNIMLGKYGETLVVDWGLAKVQSGVSGQRPDGDASRDSTIRPRMAGESSATVAGQAMGTPAYMSPEQAAGEWFKLGPTSDVYSLGATLYELLTGRPPISGIGDEVLDRARRGDFPRPSRVNPAIPSPLEAICLKAMAQQQGDRYQSAFDIKKEIECWLGDEPVSAWPEPAAVRLRRWARRHSRLTTGIAVGLVAGVIGFAALAWQREQARQAVIDEQAATARERDEKEAARAQAVQQRDRARAARRRTREALDAMTSEATGDSLVAQKSLSPEQERFLQSVLPYYQEFAAESEEDRDGRERLGRAHLRLAPIQYRLGKIPDAAATYRRAQLIYQMLVVDFPTVADYQADLAGSHLGLGVMLEKQGDRNSAIAEYRTALALREKLVQAHPNVAKYRFDLAASHNNLGDLYRDLGRSDDAEKELRAALQIRTKLAADFPDVAGYRFSLAGSHNDLGYFLGRMGRRADAATELQAALAIQEKLVAEFPTSPQYRKALAGSYYNLAPVLEALGQINEATDLLRKSLTVRVKLATDFPAVPEHRADVAACHNSLAIQYRHQGRFDDAVREHRAAMELWQQLANEYVNVPNYRNELATCQNNLGIMYVELKRLAEAADLCRKACEIRVKLAREYATVPEYRSAVADSYETLGAVYGMLEQPKEAEPNFRKSIEILSQLTTEYPKVPSYRAALGRNLNNLAQLLTSLQRLSEAETELRRALVLDEALTHQYPKVPMYRRDLAANHHQLGEVLKGLGRLDPAEASFRAALAIRQKLVADYPAIPAFRNMLGETDMGLAATLAGLATKQSPRSAERFSEAVQLLRQALLLGVNEVGRIVSDSDFAVLRHRDDFAALVWEFADLPSAR